MDTLIKMRIYGSDKDFMAWLRENYKKLPSREGDTRTGAQDVDSLIHNFMLSVDRQGTRKIQALMIVEVKTRGGGPDPSQQDTWRKLDLFKGQKELDGQIIRFFGVFYLFLFGTRPDNSERIEWGIYRKDGEIDRRVISLDMLFEILKAERHPRDLQRQAFRRRHKTEEIARQKLAPLGFIEFEKVVKRS